MNDIETMRRDLRRDFWRSLLATIIIGAAALGAGMAIGYFIWRHQ